MNDTRKIIKGIKNRDDTIFNLLYKQYYKLLKHIIFNLVKNSDTAEELVQEVFLRIYEKIDLCDETKNFKYWIIQIAKNLSYDYLNKEKNKQNIEFEKDYEEKDILNRYDKEKIVDFLKTNLMSEEFDIFILHFYHGMKFKEIANLYNATVSSITSKYSRALKKLRRLNIDKEIFYE